MYYHILEAIIKEQMLNALTERWLVSEAIMHRLYHRYLVASHGPDP